MDVVYFSTYTLPRPGIALRMLRRVATFNRTQGTVVYWLTAIADYSLTRTQLLPQGVPVGAYVTYPLSRAFRRSGMPVRAGRAARFEDRGIAAPLALGTGYLTPQRPPAQDRNYLLDQQQALYDEIVASRTFPLVGNPAVLRPDRFLLSAAEITRGLAGWTSPPAASSRASQPDAGRQQ